ncbi:helix-turn-helix transcriptional regulator [Actinokineospora guangxiensis]|uniref:Helix-turn-helix transcriptional regulator n=1 Tax=Actinokineospora guangxiensis TaxID=1490288 RepID=A0ABW0ER53_9PSEU
MQKTSSRLLSLLSLLQSRRDWPGTVLAERLGTSLRTVRRDVDRLRELGYPVTAAKGPDGGYRLGAGAQLPPLLFDDEQAVALTVALQVASGDSGLGEASARALATVRQVLPARLRHRVDAVRVSAVGGRQEPVDGAVLLAIGEAVRAREVLHVDYRGPDGPPRRVQPHHLVSRGGRWYLVGFDLDRGDWRVFRVDRLALRVPNGPRFVPREVPGGDVAAFVLGRFRGSADGGWPCRGTVVLGLPAARVAPFAGDGVVEELGPRRCSLVAGSWSWVALAASLGRFDAEVEVVEPVELVAAFALLAERFARSGALAGPGGAPGAGAESAGVGDAVGPL